LGSKMGCNWALVPILGDGYSDSSGSDEEAADEHTLWRGLPDGGNRTQTRRKLVHRRTRRLPPRALCSIDDACSGRPVHYISPFAWPHVADGTIEGAGTQTEVIDPEVSSAPWDGSSCMNSGSPERFHSRPISAISTVATASRPISALQTATSRPVSAGLCSQIRPPAGHASSAGPLPQRLSPVLPFSANQLRCCMSTTQPNTDESRPHTRPVTASVASRPLRRLLNTLDADNGDKDRLPPRPSSAPIAGVFSDRDCLPERFLSTETGDGQASRASAPPPNYPTQRRPSLDSNISSLLDAGEWCPPTRSSMAAGSPAQSHAFSPLAANLEDAVAVPSAPVVGDKRLSPDALEEKARNQTRSYALALRGRPPRGAMLSARRRRNAPSAGECALLHGGMKFLTCESVLPGPTAAAIQDSLSEALGEAASARPLAASIPSVSRPPSVSRAPTARPRTTARCRPWSAVTCK